MMTDSDRLSSWTAYLVAMAMVAAATAFGALIDPWLPTANISVAYLMAVLLVAIRSGLKPAILTSVLSFLAFNFFFTEPRFTFVIADTQHLLTVAFFLVAAMIVSNMASRLRVQMEETRESARRTANLYDFASMVAAAVSRDDVLRAVVRHVAATIRGQAVVLLPGPAGLSVAASESPEDQLDAESASAADWVWEQGKSAGRGTDHGFKSLWMFLPMRTGRGRIGVLGVRFSTDADFPPCRQIVMLDALADQAAVAIERTMLVADIEAARVSTERERLRSALLSSLSHDLRTPLASIIGSASSLLNDSDKLSSENRSDLAQTIQEEADRLNRFVQNLLDMTKLGAGGLKPRVDWADLRDIVRGAVARARRLARMSTIETDIDATVPLLCVDAVLIEQAIFNLLDNALKYSPNHSVVKVWARRQGDHVVIEVVDQGPGIAEDDREKVFDMLFRSVQADSQAAGTGLGLAICRGIIAAHGGTVRAESGLYGVGTGIIIRLPVAAAIAAGDPLDEA